MTTTAAPDASPTAPTAAVSQHADAKATRQAAPPLPQGTLAVEAPPDLVQPEGGLSGLMMAMPAVGSVGSVAMIAFGSQGSASAMRYVFAGCILLASLGFVAAMVTRNRARHVRAVTRSRQGYLEHLHQVRGQVRRASAAQQEHATWHLPAPASLGLIASSGSRLWERGGSDEDLLRVRLGTADQTPALQLSTHAPATLSDPDPVATGALQRFLATHALTSAVPFGLDLRTCSHLTIRAGASLEDAGRAYGLTRAVLCHLATFAPPEEVRIMVARSPGAAAPSSSESPPWAGDGPEAAGLTAGAAWSWLRWLPHAWEPGSPAPIPPDACASWDEACALLEGLDRPDFSPMRATAAPHLVLVLDGDLGDFPPARRGAGDSIGRALKNGMQGVTLVTLDLRPPTAPSPEVPDPPFGAVLTLAERSTLRGAGGEIVHLEPDTMGIAQARALARRLTAPALARRTGTTPSAAATRLSELLDLSSTTATTTATGVTRLRRTWTSAGESSRLHVPIGVDASGAPVALDLKESSQGGIGPHGLLIGATGSGKSEVLRTLVLALTLTHSPEDLNLLLIDFKGGATFTPFASLPHVAATITNLSDELDLVERMAESLQGELTRRQQVLRACGPFADVAEYERARRGGREDLEPMPALLIVCDEFSELLSARPEFAETFAMIGRLGRSLRIHLLLASQRLEEGRLRGLESHLSYRIGLRTFSAAESRQVLGIPDAHELPAQPGLGYLRSGPGQIQAFRAAYVSGSNGDALLESSTPGSGGEPGRAMPSELHAGVQAMAGQGRSAHRIWLPPLTVAPDLADLLGDLREDADLGLHSPSWRARREVPLALVDLPHEQRRETLAVPLDGPGGNVAFVGAPRSGTSTALRTLVTALALTHTPLETQIFVLDLGGGLGSLRSLPQVAGYARRRDADVVRRSVAEVATILREREAFFAERGIDTLAEYRASRGPGCDDGYGDIVLVVDDYGTLRADHEDLAATVTEIAARGLAFGVRIALSARRWLDLRSALKELIGTRLELRLGETTDSIHARRLAQRVPTEVPGRGLSPEGRAMLVALPGPTSGDGPIGGETQAGPRVAGELDLATRITGAWRGPDGPRLRLLPTLVTRAEVRHDTPTPPGTTPTAREPLPEEALLLGLDEESLRPCHLSREQDRLVTAFGDSGSGKSALLRLVAQELTSGDSTRAEDQLLLLDPRRALLGDIPDRHLLGYAVTHEDAHRQVADLASYLRGRLPGPEVTPTQLRERSWWTGSEVSVLVDDYDLLTTSQGSALAPLVPLVPYAADIGLRLVLTRRTAGAARGSFDPALQAMRDRGATGILLSGDPSEGPLAGGVKSRPAPPGRALLVRREETRVLQIAYAPPPA